MTQIHNFDEEMLTEERIIRLANETGLSYADAKRMLIEILDEEYAPIK